MNPNRMAIAVLFFSALARTTYSQELGEIGERLPSGYLMERLQRGEELGIAPEQGARPVSALGLDLIKHFEGWFPSPYDDPAGFCTIGYGHLISLRTCASIDVVGYMLDRSYAIPLTEDQGERLLETDTSGARRVVEELVTVPMTRDQFSALVSFVFNVGEGNFRNSTLFRHLNAQRYEEAADQFPRWVRAGDRVLEGLVVRRDCERTLFLGRLRPDLKGGFTRTSCESLGIGEENGRFLDVSVPRNPQGDVVREPNFE